MTELALNADADDAVREAFARTLKYQEGQNYDRALKAGWLETPLGIMLAAGDDEHLYMLSCIEQSSMERKAAVIQKKLQARLEMGEAASILSVTREMREFFDGKRREFETPLAPVGTSFQMRVWEELRRIPFGSAIPYAELARRIDKPAAFRAVAQANSQNPLAIVIPCHRVKITMAVSAATAPGWTGSAGFWISRRRFCPGDDVGENDSAVPEEYRGVGDGFDIAPFHRLMQRLRDPDRGCPWDRKQTLSTMGKSLV
jgi:O-6-methylguanine DNA methyltransferase